MKNKSLQVVESDPNETRKMFIERCLKKGLTIKIPAANELQIDIDCEAHYEQYKRSSAIFFREVQAQYGPSSFEIEEHFSKSGPPRRHITIKLPWDITTSWERIAWQAALGSDSVRELLSAVRYSRDDEVPTLFAELL